MMNIVPNEENIGHLNRKIEELKKQIAKLRQKNRRLRELCIKDELTGLYNWRRFNNVLKRMCRYRGLSSLIFFDVDNLKFHNDTRGHTGGNQILKGIAKSVKKSIRKDVDSAYRFGGDEFAVILPGCSSSQAKSIAQMIVSNLCELGYKDVTLSFGIVELQQNMDHETLLKHADDAMYASKNDPHNKIHIYNACLVTRSNCSSCRKNIL